MGLVPLLLTLLFVLTSIADPIPNPINLCTRQNCGGNCNRDWANIQWGARMKDLIKKIEVQPSLFYIDGGYIDRALLSTETRTITSYDGAKSKAYLCKNDLLYSNFYIFSYNGYGPEVISDAWVYPINTNPQLQCSEISPDIPLPNFKDSRSGRPAQVPGHASGSIEIHSGYYFGTAWSQGYNGYLTTLLLNVEGYEQSLDANPPNLNNDETKPVLKPLIYHYADEGGGGTNFVPKFFEDILARIKIDKTTIIVSTGIFDNNDINQIAYYQIVDVANQIFREGGLVIALVGNNMLNQGAPASAVNAIGVGAVDLTTSVTWVENPATNYGQATGATTVGDYLKPDIQGYTKLCYLNPDLTVGFGTSTSTPTVAALGMAMHAILKAYKWLFIDTYRSVEKTDHYNGLIAAWILNSGRRSPQTKGNVVETGEPYDPSRTGNGLWMDPGKQFYPEKGLFFFFSMEKDPLGTIYVPIFTLPSTFVGASRSVSLKYTVYFRVKETSYFVTLEQPFLQPTVLLKYLTHRIPYTKTQSPFEEQYLQETTPGTIKWSDMWQGNKAYVTYHYQGVFTKPGTIYLRVATQNMDAFYITAYLEDISETTPESFHPATPWDSGQFNYNCDGGKSYILFKQVRTSFMGGLDWLEAQPGNQNPNPPSNAPAGGGS